MKEDDHLISFKIDKKQTLFIHFTSWPTTSLWTPIILKSIFTVNYDCLLQRQDLTSFQKQNYSFLQRGSMQNKV
jgi:hypothetical protein